MPVESAARPVSGPVPDAGPARRGHDCLWAGEPLQLLPERAVWWPRRRTLLVADVHLGKGAAFRRQGIAIPGGSTRDDLQRLDALIDRHRAERLVVLGDLLHDRLPADDPTLEALLAFRRRHAGLALLAVRGNHDRAVERLPAALDIDWAIDRHPEPPFVFAHQPAPDPRGAVLAGHLHPVLRLRSATDSARLPVFWLRHAERIAVLPAFGSFTGGWPVQPAPGDEPVAVTPEGLVALPARPAGAAAAGG